MTRIKLQFFFKVHHFANNTNLIHFNKLIASLNKFFNFIMKKLNQWLNANKISLNVQETELVIFKHLREKLCSEIKIKRIRKSICPSVSIS